MLPLILASNNQHKLRELRSFLQGLPYEVKPAAEFPDLPPLIEDGETFEANALKKAQIVHRHTGLLSLADDSGLEVLYLNGRPGVYSARYAGEGAGDEANNEKLLKEMRGVPPRRRRSQFRCVLALVGKGIQQFAFGSCLGNLAEFPRGTNGFGYDPIFLPDGFDCTYAELTAEQKNQISHRSRAFAEMRKILEAL